MQWVRSAMGGGSGREPQGDGALASSVAVPHGGGTGGGAGSRLSSLRSKVAKASTRPSLLDKSK
jgi:hypothetical protein